MAVKTDILLLITFIMFLNTRKIVSKKRSHKKHTTNTGAPSQKILLVSLDGWRWDFVSKNKQLLPNMAKLEKQGVMANHVENVFPTNTFPNHYSTVTGLYPENHGIIDNQMYDTKTGVKFSMESTDPEWWNEAEPIWVTNQIQGHKSGVCYWPGHNVKIRGVLPTYRATHRNYGNPVVDFDKPLMPHKERIDLTLQWLQQPGVTFAAMYFEDIDSMCHKLGNIEKNVGQTDVKNAMQKLDDAFSYLSTRMDGLGLSKKVNVIFIGMSLLLSTLLFLLGPSAGQSLTGCLTRVSLS